MSIWEWTPWGVATPPAPQHGGWPAEGGELGMRLPNSPQAYGHPAHSQPWPQTGVPALASLNQRRAAALGRPPRDRSCMCGTGVDLCGDDDIVTDDITVVQTYSVLSPGPGGGRLGSPQLMTPGQSSDATRKMFFGAVMRDDIDAMQQMLHAGVDIKGMRNGAGQSPLQVATERGKQHSRAFLMQQAAQRADMATSPLPPASDATASRRSSFSFPCPTNTTFETSPDANFDESWRNTGLASQKQVDNWEARYQASPFQGIGVPPIPAAWGGARQI
eukprot:TRINITY_DN38578_c0_g1_i1.p1 TRINITY_DN38578_c0_g1~~TRINITY_DN38578_c0_g1_i1.p1  ORF type:complete len:275 (+),score=52.81 TRINITY_DN38578_c0_g1_i1:81-905(+)